MLGSDTFWNFTPTWENDPFWQTYFEVKGLKPPAIVVLRWRDVFEKKRLEAKARCCHEGFEATVRVPFGEWRLTRMAPVAQAGDRKVGIAKLPISKWYTERSNSYETKRPKRVSGWHTSISSSDIGFLGHEGRDDFQYSRLGGFTNPCNTIDVFYHQTRGLYSIWMFYIHCGGVCPSKWRVFFLLGLLLKGQGGKLLVSFFGNQACGNYRRCNLLLIEGYLLARIVVAVMVWLVNWLLYMMHQETCVVFSIAEFPVTMFNHFRLGSVWCSTTIRLKLLWLNHLAAAAHVSHGSYVDFHPKSLSCVVCFNVIQLLSIICSMFFAKKTPLPINRHPQIDASTFLTQLWSRNMAEIKSKAVEVRDQWFSGCCLSCCG